MLSPNEIASLLAPYLPLNDGWSDLYVQLATYLELLLKWNAITNLTAIREPEDIVCRHFGESLFVGRMVTIGHTNTLLDFGSGAGFPGIPIQLLHPTLSVTLAESQGKKSAFLREVTRALNLHAEIWPHRVQSMPPARTFHTVTLRAVDNMETAILEAAARATHRLLILTTMPAPSDNLSRRSDSRVLPYLDGFTQSSTPIPGSSSGILVSAVRQIVPRGTIVE